MLVSNHYFSSKHVVRVDHARLLCKGRQLKHWNLISEMALVAEVNIMFFCDVCVRVLLLQPESQLAGSFGCRLEWKHSWEVVIQSRTIPKGYNFNFSHQYHDVQTNHLAETWHAKERAMPISVQQSLFQERIQLNDHLQDNLLASLRKLPFLC